MQTLGKFLPFILFSLGIMILLFGYTSWRILSPFRLSLLPKLIYFFFISLIILSIYFSMFSSIMDKRWPSITFFSWIGFTGLGLFMLLFFLITARDLVYLAFSWFTPLLSEPSASQTVTKLKISRKEFFLQSSSLAMGLSGAILTGYSIYRALAKPIIENIQIPVKGLPADLDGFRIVQLSDLHIGPILKKDFMMRTVNTVNSLSPDVVAITGDLVDGGVAYLKKEVQALKQIKTKHGVFFSTGNHEYYSGVEQWLDYLPSLGVKILNNESHLLKLNKAEILIGGIPDPHGSRFLASHKMNLAQTFSHNQTAFKILLAHQPRQIKAAVQAGANLMLCGHTHGGQIFPFNFFVRLEQPYVSGLHRYEKTWIYVHRGTGFWGPPMRLQSPPEIAVIELKSV